MSKGTYIRTLGEDIGEALGCGAHLSSLRRTATGGFDAAQCVTLEALEAMTEDERLARLLPAEALVAGHTPRHARRRKMRHVSCWGLRRARRLARCGRGGGVRRTEAGEAFLGTAHVKAGELIPGRLLNPIEIQQILLTEATP